MLVSSGTKEFEKPKAGLFQAVLADIVDLGPIFNKKYNATKPMVQFTWVLNAKDSAGNYFRVFRRMTASMAQKPKESKLFGTVKDMTGKVPEVPFELENLIGVNSRLLVGIDDGADGTKWANVKAILTIEPGTPIFAVPEGFVRKKDKPAQSATEQTGGTASAPVAAPTAAPIVAAAPAAVEIDDEEIPF